MRKLLTLLAVAAVALTAAMTGAPATAANNPGKPLTVMTRNVYLGADINRPLRAVAAAGEDPMAVLFALGQATYQTRAIVDQTDFRVRAQLLAGEIARAKPDLVGLQEVALWRHGPIAFKDGSLDLSQIGVPNATEVDYDYLQLLLDALADAGAPYRAVQVAERADVEAPAFKASPVEPGARDVRMTMRDVILMREGGNDLRVVDSGQAIYATNLDVTLVGKQMNFDRGYNWVDVRHGSRELRFVNTHTEAFSSDIALAQVQELAAEAVAPDKPTILVCDCNSDPLNNTVKAIDHVPHKAPYDFLVGDAGFTDMWLTFAPADQGWTSGLSETVDDPTAAKFDHRIDMVMVHDPGRSPFADRGEVTGTSLADRDPATGLWPSDHGGVVLRLRGL